jgi:hypothetical protein
MEEMREKFLNLFPTLIKYKRKIPTITLRGSENRIYNRHSKLRGGVKTTIFINGNVTPFLLKSKSLLVSITNISTDSLD